MSDATDKMKNIARERQAKAKILLYTALTLKVFLTLLSLIGAVPGLGFLRGILSLFNFISGVFLALFLAAELFLLSPVGLALMCILLAVIFFFLPYTVILFLGMMIDSLFLLFVGGLICYALSGIILTFVGGWLVSAEVFVVSAPFYIAAGVGAAVAGAGGAVAYGTKAVIDKAGGGCAR